MFLTKLLQQKKYRSNFSVFSAKAKTFPQCGKIFGALFMTLYILYYFFFWLNMIKFHSCKIIKWVYDKYIINQEIF